MDADRRRALLALAAAGGTGALAGLAVAGNAEAASITAAAAGAAAKKPAAGRGAGEPRPAPGDARVGVGANGTYPQVPLAKPTVRVAAVQSRLMMLDPASPEKSRAANLEYMLEWADRAQSGPKNDLLLFHELPLTGLEMDWDRKTILAGCIEIPGPETEAIGKKARELGCYIVFGSYVRDRDWPGHYMSMTTIIGPDGTIVDKQWKARNIMGALSGGRIELMTTTIFNVLDRYVEMYGIDRVIPVARTPIGNIATSSVQLEPELYRAFGIKGAEIVLRTATGRFRMADVQGASLHNEYWSVIVNNAWLPFSPAAIKGYFPPDGDYTRVAADSTTVLSTFVDPQGNIVQQAHTPEEMVVSYEIPVAALRAKHRQPVVHQELYDVVMRAYVNKFPPNAYLKQQPQTAVEAAQYISSHLNWKT